MCIGEDLEKRELIRYSWGYKMVQSLWRKYCQFLKKNEYKFTIWPAILLIRCLREIKAGNSLVIQWLGLHFHCWNSGLIPVQGTGILRAEWHSQKKKRKKMKKRKINKNINSHLYKAIQRSNVHSSQKVEIIQMFISGSMNKHNVLYPHSEILFGNKK